MSRDEEGGQSSVGPGNKISTSDADATDVSRTGVERHVCPICDATYSDAWDLILHKEAVHECPVCRMLCQDETKRLTHLREAHRVVDELGDDGSVRYRGIVDDRYAAGPCCELRFDDPKILGAYIRARLPDDPWPEDAADRARWLHPICLRLAQWEVAERGLVDLPEELRDRARYVEPYWRCAREAVQQKRYLRLESKSARAAFLAKALALPEKSPGRAEQLLKGIKFDPVR